MEINQLDNKGIVTVESLVAGYQWICVSPGYMGASRYFWQAYFR
jgi:hypothetical protein